MWSIKKLIWLNPECSTKLYAAPTYTHTVTIDLMHEQRTRLSDSMFGANYNHFRCSSFVSEYTNIGGRCNSQAIFIGIWCKHKHIHTRAHTYTTNTCCYGHKQTSKSVFYYGIIMGSSNDVWLEPNRIAIRLLVIYGLSSALRVSHQRMCLLFT